MAGASSPKKYLHHVLLPVVRYCLRRSIKLQDLIETAKNLYLEAAEEELKKAGEKINASKLSLMTGVHRKDVVRLTRDYSTPKKSSDLLTRIIGHWQSDERFVTAQGQPRILSFKNGEGQFAELVGSISKEIKPYSILQELERAGIIERSPRGIKLLVSMYVPGENLEEGYLFLEEDMNDLVASVEENLLMSPDVRNLHLKTEFTNIPEGAVPVIKRWLLLEGSNFQNRVRKYLSRFDRDINPRAKGGGEPMRVALASFSVVEKTEIVDESE